MIATTVLRPVFGAVALEKLESSSIPGRNFAVGDGDGHLLVRLTQKCHEVHS